MDERELRPVGRYEWEQIVRRARLGALVSGSSRVSDQTGKRTKGSMSGALFTGIALAWASYADDKGRDIWPGDATVAVDMETTIKAVREVRQALVRLGLMEFVRSRRGRRGDEYRLTMSSDLMESVEVLTPAQHGLAAGRLRDQSRGRRKVTGEPPTRPPTGGPPDHPGGRGPSGLGGPAGHPESADNPASGSPADHPNASADVSPGWSAGPAHDALGWSAGPRWGGPADRSTDHDRTTEEMTDQTTIALRTAVTVPRARGREQAQISSDEVQHALPSLTVIKVAARPGCGSHPSMAGGVRPDGLPACPFCRRDARRTASAATGGLP